MSNKTKTTGKRGRPTVAGSKRQAVLAMREAKRAQGIEIKRGRPKMIKDETIVEVPSAGKKLTAREVTKDVAVVTMEDLIANVTDTPAVPKVKESKAAKQAKLAAKINFNPEVDHESLQVL
jgi:hypothetical protein